MIPLYAFGHTEVLRYIAAALDLMYPPGTMNN